MDIQKLALKLSRDLVKENKGETPTEQELQDFIFSLSSNLMELNGYSENQDLNICMEDNCGDEKNSTTDYCDTHYKQLTCNHVRQLGNEYKTECLGCGLVTIF